MSIILLLVFGIIVVDQVFIKKPKNPGLHLAFILSLVIIYRVALGPDALQHFLEKFSRFFLQYTLVFIIYILVRLYQNFVSSKLPKDKNN